MESESTQWAFASRVLKTVESRRMKLNRCTNNAEDFLAELFDQPDINEKRTSKLRNDLVPERPRPQDVLTESASATPMDEKCGDVINKLVEEQSSTDPSTAETMRERYPLCSKIGLELGVKPKSSAGQGLDPYLLTNGVMIEVANFTKYVCRIQQPHQIRNYGIIFDILKHNFDLDIEGLGLHRLFSEKLRVTTVQYGLVKTSQSRKFEFVNQRFNLTPIQTKQRKIKRRREELSEHSMKQVAQSRRQSLKRKLEEKAKLESAVLKRPNRCSSSNRDVLPGTSFVSPLGDSDLDHSDIETASLSENAEGMNVRVVKIEDSEEQLLSTTEPLSSSGNPVEMVHSYHKPYSQITEERLDVLPIETMVCDGEITQIQTTVCDGEVIHTIHYNSYQFR